MEIKGIKKIDKIINNFTMKNFGVTARFDTEFEAFCDEGRKLIGYTLITTEGGEGQFIEDATRRYPEINADIFLWALMHEIGHCMTEDMWTPEEREYFYYQKDMIYEMEVEEEGMNAWYHACPDEFFATKWAGDYMRNHPKKMKKFWNELQVAMLQMYKKNNLIQGLTNLNPYDIINVSKEKEVV